MISSERVKIKLFLEFWFFSNLVGEQDSRGQGSKGPRIQVIVQAFVHQRFYQRFERLKRVITFFQRYKIQLFSNFSPTPIRLVMGFPLVRRQSLGTILASRLSLDPKPLNQGAGLEPRYAGYFLPLPLYAHFTYFFRAGLQPVLLRKQGLTSCYYSHF